MFNTIIYRDLDTDGWTYAAGRDGFLDMMQGTFHTYDTKGITGPEWFVGRDDYEVVPYGT